METKNTLRIAIPVLEEICNQLFIKCGLDEEGAAIMTDSLVKAQARGVGSHGLMRLPAYCKRLIDGGSSPNPQPRVIIDLPSLILVDGDNGMGQVVSVKTMNMVIDRAKRHGICFAAVRNSGHFGFAGYYPMMAVSQGMIGITASNCPPNMAVWGGSRPAIGNNPIAIATPTRKAYPLVLDIAMSVASGGKVRLNAMQGNKIPFEWILDGHGRRTDDPKDLGVTGTLLPLGHKGSGLAVILEVLTSVLTNSAMLSEIGLWFRDTSIPLNNGHMFLAINIETLLPLETFLTRIDRMIDELKDSPLMEGSTGIYMPGEIEYLTERESVERGVPVAAEVLKLISEFAAELGVPEIFNAAAFG